MSTTVGRLNASGSGRKHDLCSAHADSVGAPLAAPGGVGIQDGFHVFPQTHPCKPQSMEQLPSHNINPSCLPSPSNPPPHPPFTPRDPSPAVFQAVIAPSARTLGDFKLTEVADLLRGLSRIAFHHHLRLASPPAPAPHAPNAAVNPFLTPACSRLFDSAMAIVGEEGHAAAPRVRTQLRRALLQFNWVESQQRQGATSGGDRQAEAASHGEDDSSTSSDGGGGDSGSPGSTSAGGGGDASVDGVGGGHQDISEFRRHSGVMHAAMLTCSPVRRRAFEVLRDAK